MLLTARQIRTFCLRILALLSVSNFGIISCLAVKSKADLKNQQ